MDREKVLSLAKLARIEISEDEASSLSHEFDSILTYVGEVKGATLNNIDSIGESQIPINVMRPDGEPHAGGLYTEKILSQAPAREGEYIKVKKIL